VKINSTLKVNTSKMTDTSADPVMKTAAISAVTSLLVDKFLLGASPFSKHSLAMAAVYGAVPYVYQMAGSPIDLLRANGFILFPLIAAGGTYWYRMSMLSAVSL
jgi:hypothetical protein